MMKIQRAKTQIMIIPQNPVILVRFQKKPQYCSSDSEHDSSNDDQIDNSSDYEEHINYDIDESHSDQYDSDEYSSCSN